MQQLNGVCFNNEELLPSKIVCVGRNYLDHIAELGNQVPTEPVIFMKPNSAISNTLIYNQKDKIHYEAELCFIVKNRKVAGVGIGLDLTKRILQNTLKEKGLPWERAKAFDGSVVFSRFVDLPTNIEDLSMSLKINGVDTQHANYALMINKPDELIRNIGAFMTLIDNDIIMTGTPSGVGEIATGQVFEAEVYVGEQVIVSKKWTVE